MSTVRDFHEGHALVREAVDDLRTTALSAAGYVIVPKDPTEEMVGGAETVLHGDLAESAWVTRDEVKDVYRAMISAVTKE